MSWLDLELTSSKEDVQTSLKLSRHADTCLTKVKLSWWGSEVTQS